jgi:hypothetical protein
VRGRVLATIGAGACVHARPDHRSSEKGGGKPAMVALLCSYLRDAEPLRHNDFYGRAGDV